MKSTNFITISNKNRELSHNVCYKFYNGAEKFASTIGNDEQEKQILNQADSVLSKFLTAGVNLEFLWQIHYVKEDSSKQMIHHSTEWENTISFTDYIFLDNFVCQSRSFIDHLQNLTLFVLGIDKKWSTRNQFNQILNDFNSNKARKVLESFEVIFEKGNWGNILNRLRNKIMHNETYKTNSSHKPLIENKEYQRFCQDMENSMFEFLIELFELLFEHKWKAGY